MSFKSSTKKHQTEEQSHEQSQLHVHEEQPVLLKEFYELMEREQIKSKHTLYTCIKFYVFLGMLHWFVEENAVLKPLVGIAIEESNIEVDPNNLCRGVTDEMLL